MRIVVIGGGISGLACAWRLREQGHSVMVLEQEDRAGGVIRSERRDGVLFEAGPQSFLLSKALAELISDIGLQDEVLLGASRAPRFVLLGGKLRRVPLSPPAILFSGLLSWKTKKRLFAEPFGKTAPPPEDESIAAFVRRKFTPELLDRMVGPMVGGIYAGDPERLSLRAAFPALHAGEARYGSIVRGMMKSSGDSPRGRLAALREGNDALVRRLAERLGDSLRCGARALSITRAAAGGDARYEVAFDHRSRRETIPAAAVIVAAPARAAAALLSQLVPAAAELARVEYAPVAVVGASYATEHLKQPLHGFGFLVPRAESLRILGTVWNSSIFPGRAPAEQTMLTSFIGGATDPAAAALPELPLYQTVESELRRVLGIFFQPKVRFAQRWPQAIPQYGLGHSALIERVRAALAASPGLHLAGNYLDGPSVGACVETANAVTASLHAR